MQPTDLERHPEVIVSNWQGIKGDVNEGPVSYDLYLPVNTRLRFDKVLSTGQYRFFISGGFKDYFYIDIDAINVHCCLKRRTYFNELHPTLWGIVAALALLAGYITALHSSYGQWWLTTLLVMLLALGAYPLIIRIGHQVWTWAAVSGSIIKPGYWLSRDKNTNELLHVVFVKRSGTDFDVFLEPYFIDGCTATVKRLYTEEPESYLQVLLSVIEAEGWDIVSKKPF
jgi:hypothetical protein